MTFFESIKTVLRNYAEFGGRASRPEFWWFALFTTLVSAALNSLTIPYATTTGMMRPVEIGAFPFGATSSNAYGYLSFAGFWSIAVLLPSLAVTVRRLRDAGRKWTELFWLLLPIAGVIVLIVHLCDASVAPTVETPAAPAVATPPAPTSVPSA